MKFGVSTQADVVVVVGAVELGLVFAVVAVVVVVAEVITVVLVVAVVVAVVVVAVMVVLAMAVAQEPRNTRKSSQSAVLALRRNPHADIAQFTKKAAETHLRSDKSLAGYRYN
mmetsp:Transcript_77306/g.147070  ORF Transcript_77306/g.147070 Transcript_77306/m.147070 type:complete len:113 (+) Transcript_77306:78-416(+)